MPDTRMVCQICGSPVFKSQSGGWFHDMYPRSLATPARSVRPAGRKSVTDIDWEEKEVK